MKGRKHPRHAPSLPNRGLIPPDQPLPLWSRALLALLFLLLVLLAMRPVGSEDTGFHLATGEHILAGHGWPATDPFTYTVRDHAYIDTSWGYDVVLALLHRAGGAMGLALFHVLLLGTTFILLLLTCRLRPLDPTALVLAFALGILGMEMRFQVRPEVLSYTLLALDLYLLHRHASGRPTPLYLLPVIHLAWANLHSLFILGWAACGAFLIGAALRDRRIDRQLLRYTALAVVVAIVNPYGWKGVLFPFTLATRLQAANLFGQSIGEFTSPFALGLTEQFPFFPALAIGSFRIFAMLVLIALVPHLRARQWSLVLATAIFFPLAAKMVRNMPIVIVAALPVVVSGLPLGHWLFGLRVPPILRRLGPRAALAGATLFTLGLGARVATNAYYLDCRRSERFGLGWSAVSLPVQAVPYLRDANLPGRMFNHLNFGSHLLWALDREVFIDGRLEVMQEAFYADYSRILAEPEAMEAAVARWDIGWLVFPYPTFPRLLDRLSDDPRWRLTYVDPVAAVFVRSDRLEGVRIDPSAAFTPQADAIGSPTGNPERTRGLPGLGSTPRTSRLARFLEGLFRSQHFPADNFYLGIFHYTRREYTLAEARFSSAIEESHGRYYEMYLNLGSALYRQGRNAEADACYRVVLAEDPKNRIARERLVGKP